MVLIIACHFLQYYGNELAWWLNVGMQIFFVVSGFLYGNKNINDPIQFIKQRLKKILIPYPYRTYQLDYTVNCYNGLQFRIRDYFK